MAYSSGFCRLLLLLFTSLQVWRGHTGIRTNLRKVSWDSERHLADWDPQNPGSRIWVRGCDGWWFDSSQNLDGEKRNGNWIFKDWLCFCCCCWKHIGATLVNNLCKTNETCMYCVLVCFFPQSLVFCVVLWRSESFWQNSMWPGPISSAILLVAAWQTA